MKAGKNKAPSSGEDYRFMQERIKRRPVRWRRIAGRIAIVLGMGVLFGAAAAFTMEALRPAFSGMAKKEDEKGNLSLKVEQDKDSEEKQEDNEGEKDKNTNASEENGTNEAENMDRRLQDLEAGIYQIARNAEPFLVDVIGVMGEPDWFEEISQIENQTPGIIIHMEEKILILTNRSAVKNVNYIRVRFCDGTMAQGHEISYDLPTNLGIIQVDSITEQTRGTIKAASFRGEEMTQGELVLALGRPLGKFNTVVYGHIAGQTMKKYTDAVYRQIYTDIAASTKAQGVLVNGQGQVLGLINQSLASEGSENLITALGTLEIQSLVEKLMRGENPGYLGIEGETFSPDRADMDYKGEGVYITKVKKDFPAIAVGIQGGDIVTGIGGKKIKNMAELRDELLQHTVGDKVSVTLMRLGRGEYKEMTFEVELGGY